MGAGQVAHYVRGGGGGSGHYVYDSSTYSWTLVPGGDTFVFDAGYGRVEVDETDPTYNPNNTLQFGVGIDPSQVAVSGDDAGDLVLTIGAGGDQVVLDQALNDTDKVSYGVQTVLFADGTTWTKAQLVAVEETGSVSNTNLHGTASGPDVLDLNGAAHTARSGGGYASYRLDQGDGAVTLDNVAPGAAPGTGSPRGEIDFSAGIGSGQLWFARVGDDLTIDVLGTHDVTTVRDWFGNPAAQVQEIKSTSDGAEIDAGLNQLIAAMATFQTANPDFDPTTATQMPADPALQAQLAASWHH